MNNHGKINTASCDQNLMDRYHHIYIYIYTCSVEPTERLPAGKPQHIPFCVRFFVITSAPLRPQSPCWPQQPTRVTWGGVADCSSVHYAGKQITRTPPHRHHHQDPQLQGIIRAREQENPKKISPGAGELDLARTSCTPRRLPPKPNRLVLGFV